MITNDAFTRQPQLFTINHRVPISELVLAIDKTEGVENTSINPEDRVQIYYNVDIVCAQRPEGGWCVDKTHESERALSEQTNS